MNSSVNISFARFFKEESMQSFLYYLSKKCKKDIIVSTKIKVNSMPSELVGNESDTNTNKPFCLHNNRFYRRGFLL